MLQSLGRPGCSGRRNCNVNLDELRGDRPDLDCEPQQAGASPAIFTWTRQGAAWRCGVRAGKGGGGGKSWSLGAA